MIANIIILGLVAVIVGAIPALAEYPSPLKQIQMGTEPDDILCNADRVHAIRDNGNHVCVTEATAHRVGWIIFDQMMAEMPVEYNTSDMPVKRITVTPQADSESHESSSYGGIYYADTTYTYPERIEIGVPFVINYTYTYERTHYGNDSTFYEDETEYPFANLPTAKYVFDASDPKPFPRAYVADHGYDDGRLWWITRDNPFPLGDGSGRVAPSSIVTVYDREIDILEDDCKILSNKMQIDPDEYLAGTCIQYPKDHRDKMIKTVPFNNVGINSGNVTLQIDGKDNKEYHRLRINADDLGQSFYIYIDGQIGHIKTGYEKTVFPSDHVEYLKGLGSITSESQVAGALAGETDGGGMLNYSSPFGDWCTEHIGWDTLDADAKLWHILYYDCPTTRPSTPPTPEQIREHEERVARGDKILSYFEAFNVTSDFRAHIEEVRDFWGFTQEEIDGFFNTYPEFETQSLDPSQFLLTTDIDQSNIGGVIYVSGKAWFDGSNKVPPTGFEICAYDQRNNGTYTELKFNNEDACYIVDDRTDYIIPAVNTDPDDDQTAADVVVGIRNGDDIMKIVDQQRDIHVYYLHHVIRNVDHRFVNYPNIIMVQLASVSLSWSSPYDGGSPITGYDIQRRTVPGSSQFKDLATIGGSVTSYVDSTVQQGGTYDYKVRATNFYGSGPFSPVTTVSVPHNDTAPVIFRISNQELPHTEVRTVRVVATDAEDHHIVLSLVNPPGFVSISGNTIRIDPAASDAGSHTITVRATANSLTSEKTFTVRVT